MRSTSTQRQIIRGLAMLGDTQLRLGDLPEALTHLQEGLHLARDAGLPRHICDLQRNLANTYLAMNDLDAARCSLDESLTLAQSLGSHPQKVGAVSSAIAYFQRLGLNQQAALWAGTIWDESSLDHLLFASVRDQIEAALGGEAFQRALVQGKVRSLDDVVAEILGLIAIV